MADGLQDASRHAGQVVRRVLLRRTSPSTPRPPSSSPTPSTPRSAPVRPPGRRAGAGVFPRRLRPPVLTRQARAS
ncbi:MAG: hypothetical protein ACLP8X_02705 [Streptosporangiaceae bacterium]